jgi:hypothetical protein
LGLSFQVCRFGFVVSGLSFRVCRFGFVVSGLSFQNLRVYGVKMVRERERERLNISTHMPDLPVCCGVVCGVGVWCGVVCLVWFGVVCGVCVCVVCVWCGVVCGV